MKRVLESLRSNEEVVASFGEARLVRALDGKVELKGGTDEDRQQAEEWMSKFWPQGKAKASTT